MILIILLYPSLRVLGQEDSDPTQAAARYLEAFFAGDADQIQALTCSTKTVAAMDITYYAQRRSDLGLTVDVSGLTYLIEQQTDTTARLRPHGTVRVSITGLDEPLELTAVQAQLGALDLMLEDGVWKICTPPTGPDVIAREFMIAAYTGEYGTAQNLLCEAQRGLLTEEDYNAAFEDYVTGRSQMDMSSAVFTVTEQSDTDATVEISGTLNITMNGTISTYPVSDFGFPPMHMSYEDGWKVCQIASDTEGE
jgi:hypothetical protein